MLRIISSFVMISVILLIVDCVQDNSTSQNNSSCYIETPASGNSSGATWRLVWEDQFGLDTFPANWLLDNELDTSKECHGNGLKPIVACNLARNVLHQDGLLILTAKYEKYHNHNFTASTVTSKQSFGYGRIEIRALQPIGDQIRTRMLSRNATENFFLEQGQINIASNTMDTNLFRDVLAKKLYQPNDLSLFEIGELRVDLHEFHVYGMEWDKLTVRFFFDGHYSKYIKFNYTTGLAPMHNIQFQMGVGGRDLEKPKGLDTFEDLGWECPAFFIDYIRYYEKVGNDSIPSENYTICPDGIETGSPWQNGTFIEDVCQQVLQTIQYSVWARISKNWRYLVIGLCVLLLIFLVIYLVFLVVRMKRKMARDPFASLNKTSGDDEGLYEEYIYEENWKNYSTKSAKRTSYLQLDEGEPAKNNDYVPQSEYMTPANGNIKLNEDQENYNYYAGIGRREKRYVSMKRSKSDTNIAAMDIIPISVIYENMRKEEANYVNLMRRGPSIKKESIKKESIKKLSIKRQSIKRNKSSSEIENKEREDSIQQKFTNEQVNDYDTLVV